MGRLVRDGYQKLCGDVPAPKATVLLVADLIAAGESGGVEFKSTLRTNLHTHQPDEKIQLSALKTIAGFLNAHGGTLVIGVVCGGRVARQSRRFGLGIPVGLPWGIGGTDHHACPPNRKISPSSQSTYRRLELAAI
jgi:predicted HTH transcriptional regulator